ncbi:MAG: leucyl aminopeptidase [Candidatus Liptonbacteria bacterium]|nr:leucyl aminopeptidase [Candidatus Liptonbacteria bacterium]
MHKKIQFVLAKKLHKKNKVASIQFEAAEESSLVRLPSGKKMLSVGIGKEQVSRRHYLNLLRKIVTIAKAHRIAIFRFRFDDLLLPHLELSRTDAAELIATNFEMANFEFVSYKTPPPDGWRFVKTVIVTGNVDRAVRNAFIRGQRIGEEVNACRALANTPAGMMTPTILADEAKKAARGTKVKVKILGVRDIKKLKMGAILGVSQGSSEEPRFIILEYRGVPGKPIVLVGKGVTFDTGGLNLKSTEGMSDMHLDMSGGAAVIHTAVLAAKLGLKKHVIGLIPAVENMPSGSSYRPGDVLRSMSGKTIEVLNTDAEGRIILADALTYAERYKPRLVVDVATLTGAAVVALGERASAIFTKDEKLEHLVRKLGEESGDYVWPMPLWDEYKEDIKGTFGDIANDHIRRSRYGGAVLGAVFLYAFAKKYPWVHIDIAPRMTAIEGEFLSKGAAGAPMRLLIKLLEKI